MFVWFDAMMRHLQKWLCATLLAAFTIFPAAAGAEATDDLLLQRGHAEVRLYERPPSTIILGDDQVVAANVTNTDVLVLTARARGTTNVIVLDEAGKELDRFQLSVFEPGDDIAVRRGGLRQIVRCDPMCREPQEVLSSPAEPTE